MTTYSAPAEYPFQDFPSTATPLKSSAVNPIVSTLLELAGSSGRVPALEAAVVTAGDLPEAAATSAVSATALLGRTTRFSTAAGAIAQPLPRATANAQFAVGWDVGTSALSLVADSRVDSCATAAGQASVSDSSITAADSGRLVTGTGIPAATYVGTVTAGSGFRLSSSSTAQVDVAATGTSSSVSLTVSDVLGAATTTTSPFTWLGEKRRYHCSQAGRWRETDKVIPSSVIPLVPASDSAVVHNTGDESIAGVKTFTSSPLVPTATLSGQAANLGNIAAAIAASGGGGGGGGSSSTVSDSFFVDVKSYGAVGDYVVSTGVGTDNTAAIQAAIDSTAAGGANEGRVVLLTPGRYRTSGPLVLKQGTVLMGLGVMRGSAVGNQAPAYASSIEFTGGPTDNAIQAIGSSTQTISRAAVQGFTILDRRTSPTGGHGVYFEQVVNLTIVRNMDINGFPTGAAVRVTAPSGKSSDCVNIDDIWALACLYGIWVDHIDNTCLIRGIKCDSPSSAPLLAAVRVGALNGTVHVDGVKHENSKSSCVTILCETFAQGVVIDSVISRVGVGGAVLRIDSDTGRGVTARGLQRQYSGTLVEVVNSATSNQTITGTRIGYWTGGTEGYGINQAGFRGLTNTTLDINRIFTLGQLWVAQDNTQVTDEGKLSVAPDAATQKALTVRGLSGQSVDIARFYDASGTVFRLASDGTALLGRDATLAGAAILQGPITESKRTTVSDADYAATATDFVIAVTALTAPHTITLPTVAAGKRIVVIDESGQAGTYPITVARAGAPNQVIDGQVSVQITQAYGSLSLRSNGINWSGSKSANPPAATYSDEQAQDAVFGNLFLGAGLTGGYNDASNRFDIAAAAGSSLVESSLGSWMYPSAQGFVIWNAPSVLANATSGGVTPGYPFLFRLVAPSALTITNLHVWIVTAGAGLANCYLGLYSASGTLLTTSADLSTAMQSAGLLTAPLGTPQALTAGQAVWAALLIGSATTGPNFARLNSISALLANTNQTAASTNSGRISTGSQTSLPASFTPSSGLNISLPGAQWVAAS